MQTRNESAGAQYRQERRSAPVRNVRNSKSFVTRLFSLLLNTQSNTNDGFPAMRCRASIRLTETAGAPRTFIRHSPSITDNHGNEVHSIFQIGSHHGFSDLIFVSLRWWRDQRVPAYIQEYFISFVDDDRFWNGLWGRCRCG